jgi:hypothetical protein
MSFDAKNRGTPSFEKHEFLAWRVNQRVDRVYRGGVSSGKGCLKAPAFGCRAKRKPNAQATSATICSCGTLELRGRWFDSTLELFRKTGIAACRFFLFLRKIT